MDKSKSLEKLLNMVLKKNYSQVADVKVTHTLRKLWRVEERDILDHRYDIHVYFKLDSRSSGLGNFSKIKIHNITNDIKDLTKMILTEPNEHYYISFHSIYN